MCFIIKTDLIQRRVTFLDGCLKVFQKARNICPLQKSDVNYCSFSWLHRAKHETEQKSHTAFGCNAVCQQAAFRGLKSALKWVLRTKPTTVPLQEYHRQAQHKAQHRESKTRSDSRPRASQKTHISLSVTCFKKMSRDDQMSRSNWTYRKSWAILRMARGQSESPWLYTSKHSTTL